MMRHDAKRDQSVSRAVVLLGHAWWPSIVAETDWHHHRHTDYFVVSAPRSFVGVGLVGLTIVRIGARVDAFLIPDLWRITTTG
jgi:hypothetical protein